MLQSITITSKDILHQVKLSGKITSITEEIVQLNIIKTAAVQAGIEVTTEELQKFADYLRLTNKLNTAEETWKWLNQNVMSLDDFEELVYNSLVSIKLAHHLFANQVEPFFYEHQLDYSGVVMYEVILDDEDLAMELFYAITEGEVSFFEVARQYVEDTELRRSGGYKGIVPRQELKPEISAVIYSSEPPQLLKPIITSRGIHLIFVEEIVQPKLDTLLRETLVSGLFTKWLEQQVDEVEVVRKITPEC